MKKQADFIELGVVKMKGVTHRAIKTVAQSFKNHEIPARTRSPGNIKSTLIITGTSARTYPHILIRVSFAASTHSAKCGMLKATTDKEFVFCCVDNEFESWDPRGETRGEGGRIITCFVAPGL